MNSDDSPLPPTGPGAPPWSPGGTSGPQPGPTPPNGPDRIDAFFDSIRRGGIVRTNDRWIGGVASGLALRLGVDALLIRAAFGVLMLLSGVGFILYAAGWALLPEQSDGRIHLQEAIRGRFDSAIAGAGIVLFIGLFWRTGQFGWWGTWGYGWFDGLFWLALTIFAIYLFVTVRKEKSGALPPHGQQSPSATYPTTPQPTPSYPAAQDGGPQPITAPAPPNLSKSVPPQAPYVPYAAPAPQGWPGQPVKPVKAVKAVKAKDSRPPVKGPGAASLGVVVGLALLTFAGLLLADRAGAYDGSDGRIVFTTLGAATILAGTGIVVAGFRGRSSGILGFIALMAVLVSPLSLVVFGTQLSSGTLIGEGTFTPTTMQEATDGFSIGAGDLTIDLTDLPLTSGHAITVPVNMGVGDLTIILPEDTSASAEVRLGAGNATWRVEDADLSRGGVGNRIVEFQTSDVRDGATPQIHLDIQAGAGDILIKEES
ncbi:phage shock protein C (PspC) family protein [Sanguibacter gelidistatuariae]|uniref:Phage shock protein C (PspC) family protein n=1 Tax=Sanguibacter gelidistatuariae TaxID=1814289 RepID=A0A1G6KPI8_9MICO|nr:PspC domain-containing protein [Sanguibacter gelidistatuariae]SDC32999.1 phage shock protein C (PspC) family protein [Sanguibacter gelidistatuariae]